MSAAIKTFEKDPDATLDYSIDWSAWLTSPETIASVSWVVPAGITKAADTQAAGVATIWLSGGTAGQSYDIVCRVTTDSSPARIDDRTIKVKVVNR